MHINLAAKQLAEIMVTREAKKKGIPLVGKWWNEGILKKKYKMQIIAAHALLKVYEPLAILNALKHKKCQWQYSLRADGINDACIEEQEKLDKIKVLASESNREFSEAVTTEVKKFGKQSKLDKLRD